MNPNFYRPPYPPPGQKPMRNQPGGMPGMHARPMMPPHMVPNMGMHGRLPPGMNALHMHHMHMRPPSNVPTIHPAPTPMHNYYNAHQNMYQNNVPQPMPPQHVVPPPNLSQLKALTTPNSKVLAEFKQEELDKMSKVYVGNISGGISDDWMDRLLSTCGQVKEWKRMKGADGSLKAFGFVTFTDPESVMRALDILGGENTAAKISLELPSLDGSPWRNITIKIDENTRKLLDRYKSVRGVLPADVEMEKYAKARRDEVLAAIRSKAPPRPEEPTIKTESASQGQKAPGSVDKIKIKSTKDDSTVSNSSRKILDGTTRAGLALGMNGERSSKLVSANSHSKSATTSHEEASNKNVETGAKPRQRRSKWDLETNSPKVSPPSSPQKAPEILDDLKEAGSETTQKFVEIEEGELNDRNKVQLTKDKISTILKIKKSPLDLSNPKKPAGFPKFSAKSTTKGSKLEFPKSGVEKNGANRGRVLFGEDFLDSSEEPSKKRSRLVPLQYVEVPNKVDDVLNWTINWSGLTDDASYNIQLAVLRLVSQFLGTPDDDLSEFLVQSIHEKCSMHDLIEEMKYIFESDAPNFVASLFREVIRFTM